jgi:X-X-X-Leu-X-X-Gly heptad repeat protein
MMGNLAREAGPVMMNAFNAVRNSPLAREFGQMAVNEFKVKSFCTDPEFTSGVVKTLENLPEIIAKNSSSNESPLAGIATDIMDGTFGRTTKGKIGASLGQLISNAIEDTASKAANGANQLSAGFTSMQESLARATTEVMNKEPQGRIRLGGGHQ